MKKCIFYLPYKLDEHGRGARMMRPKKMIQAFTELGYEVFVIQGYSAERKRLIKELKGNIKKGEKYDFMYSESHTMPTRLTDPNHLPLHPFMDFGFFRYIRNQGIKIGLFYCDIYWKFDFYGKNLSNLKRTVAIMNYKYDLKQYEKYLSRLYVPDQKMCEYIEEGLLRENATELPPGADDLTVQDKEYTERDFSKEPLKVFYVGGIGPEYQITELAKAVFDTPDTELTLCCRKEEWEKEKESFSEYACDRIEIVHASGDELEYYYDRADICSLLFKKDIYRELAKPYKAYEYLAHEIPVIATRGTAISRFVENSGIGWSIPYSAGDIAGVFQGVFANPDDLQQKKLKCRAVKQENLWLCRARQVEQDLESD